MPCEDRVYSIHNMPLHTLYSNDECQLYRQWTEPKLMFWELFPNKKRIVAGIQLLPFASLISSTFVLFLSPYLKSILATLRFLCSNSVILYGKLCGKSRCKNCFAWHVCFEAYAMRSMWQVSEKWKAARVMQLVALLFMQQTEIVCISSSSSSTQSHFDMVYQGITLLHLAFI